MPHTLIMPIVAPMQSWGYRSRFENRDTGPEPTRSGIIGLLCAAMGIPRSADLDRFNCLRMGVRIDKPGTVKVDFHTVLDVVTASGSAGKNAVISRRHYLNDARFMVGLEAEKSSFLEEILSALRSPVWPLYLGRKSFPLALPPYLPGKSIFENTSLWEALGKAPLLFLKKGEKPDADKIRVSMEPEEDNPAALTMEDFPVSFAHRKFRQRTVENRWLPTPQPEEGGEWPCIFHR